MQNRTSRDSATEEKITSFQVFGPNFLRHNGFRDTNIVALQRFQTRFVKSAVGVDWAYYGWLTADR